MPDDSVRLDGQQRIGLAIATLMAERGLSRTEVCRRAGISEADFERYLSPTVPLLTVDAASAVVIERVAGALDVDPDRFPEYRVWRLRTSGAPVDELEAAQEEAERMPKGRWLTKG